VDSPKIYNSLKCYFLMMAHSPYYVPLLEFDVSRMMKQNALHPNSGSTCSKSALVTPNKLSAFVVFLSNIKDVLKENRAILCRILA
jgi:hypothetical protein